MIIFKTKEKEKETPSYSAFRKVFEINIEKWYADFSWATQGKSKNDNEWHSFHQETSGILFTLKFKIGMDHIYYDGPHCVLSIGFAKIYWNNQKCKKCWDY
jgi:hypothetical protein